MVQNRVLYIQYTSPAGYPPLEHSSRILADAGWLVLFLGAGVHGAAALQFPPHQNISVKEMPSCPPGWKQKLHYIRYVLWTLYWVIKWKPRWIYASDFLSSPAALAMTFLPGQKVIYHEHDVPACSLAERPSRFQRFVLGSRARLALRAAACVVPSTERATRLRAEMHNGDLVQCVWNCPSRLEVKTYSPAKNATVFSLWYHGSIVATQLPETVVRALALLPGNVKLRFAGYETAGQSGYVQHLLDLARDLGIPDRIEYLGALPTREQLLEYCTNSDVGLALFLGATKQPMVGASNKPFDYLSCALALLVPDVPDWHDFFVRPGYGLTCDPDSPQSIAAAIGWFIDHRTETKAMGEAGRRRILAEWNYETQFAPIERLMTSDLSRCS